MNGFLTVPEGWTPPSEMSHGKRVDDSLVVVSIQDSRQPLRVQTMSQACIRHPSMHASCGLRHWGMKCKAHSLKVEASMECR
eukprot:1156221-Pelagomonas_calceolata.AAC.4